MLVTPVSTILFLGFIYFDKAWAASARGLLNHALCVDSKGCKIATEALSPNLHPFKNDYCLIVADVLYFHITMTTHEGLPHLNHPTSTMAALDLQL